MITITTDVKAYDEFGFILWYHLPKAYHMHLNGILGKTSSKIGTESLFYFSNDHQEVAKHELPFNGYHACYGNARPEFTKSYWTPPPLNDRYKNDIFVYDKPILTINNKNTLEWGNRGIYNYFDSNSLESIIEEFHETHKIIYLRPVGKKNDNNYQRDTGQESIDIGDLELIKKYDDIEWIGDMLNDYPAKSYNELQFMILANSDRHIAAAGDAVVPAYFGGDLLIYGCPNCNSKNRGVWRSDSWMTMLSGCKVYGYQNYNELLNKSKELWSKK